jgi:hypothetical protein
MMYDYKILDSSIYQDPSLDTFGGSRVHNSIYIGSISEVKESGSGNQIKYTVEFYHNSNVIAIDCRPIFRFGGLANYEEYRLRPYKPDEADSDEDTSSYDDLDNKVGDTVVIGLLDGSFDEGVILGTIGHGFRESNLDTTNYYYESMYNGVKTRIRNDGTYQLIWNGIPTNLEKLDQRELVVPEFDETVAGSFLGFDNTGGFTITDAAKQTQSFRIDKSSNKIILKSGANIVEIGQTESGADAFTVKVTDAKVTAKKVNIKASDAMNIQGKDVSIKGDKIAIGNDTTELFDVLCQLIDALGGLIVTSPTGPCNPLRGAPTWAVQVIPLKQKLAAIKGAVSDADEVSDPEEGEDPFAEPEQ